MQLQESERTTTKVSEGGVVKSERVLSVNYKLMEGDNQIGNASLTATGLNINMYQGLGDDLAKWETNINAAFAALNQEV